MHNTIITPDGWNVKSSSRELQSQLHGNILPKGYILYFSESEDFSETTDFAVDVPDYLQKTAKPGFIFTNKETGHSLQKGQDGIWRRIQEAAQKVKQKAKKFVGKLTGKKKKPSAPFTPDEEYDPEYLPPKGLEDGDKEDEGPTRAAPEKLEKDTKPELSPEELEDVNKNKKGWVEDISNIYAVIYASDVSPEKKEQLIEQAKAAAKLGAKQPSLKTGKSPDKTIEEILEQGQKAALPKAIKVLTNKTKEAYKKMIIAKLKAESAGLGPMHDYAKWAPLADKYGELSKKLLEIHKKMSGEEEEPSSDIIEAIKKEVQEEIENENKPAPEKKEDELPELTIEEKAENVGEALTGLSDAIKYAPMKEEMGDMLDNIKAGIIDPILSGDDINEVVKEINNDSPQYKSSISLEFQDLLEAIQDIKDSGDEDNYKKAINQYKNIVETLKEIGIDEKYLPDISGIEESPEGGDNKKEILDDIGIAAEDIFSGLGDESSSIKGSLKAFFGDVQSGLFGLIDPNDINGSIEELHGKGQGYKDSISASLEACYGYLNDAKKMGDPYADEAIKAYKGIIDKMKLLGLEDYIPEDLLGEKGQEEENLSPEELYNKAFDVKNGLLGLLGSNSLSIKGPVKKDLEYLQEMFFEYLDEDSLQADIEDLKDSEPFQKAEVKNKFVQLGKKIKNMKGLGDPNADEAIDKYKEMIDSLQKMGLEDFVPKIRQKQDKIKQQPQVSEEEQNYGKMLDPDFRYEPEVKYEDLSEVWRQRFQTSTDIFQDRIDDGRLPDIFDGVKADSLAAINNYTGNAYSWINNLARGKAKVSDDSNLMKKYDYMLGLVDQGLQQMKVQPPETLNRGVGSEKLRKALSVRKPGEIIYDHGYFSASSKKAKAKDFEGNYLEQSVMFTVKNAQGYYIEDITQCEGEEERIFPRGSAFKILKVEELPNGQLGVEMEYLPSDAEKEKYQKQLQSQKEQQEQNRPAAEIPKSIDESVYNSGKKLGGSTGARLVDIDGTKFVVKMGANEEQNYQEQLANSLYQSIGAKTSNSGLSEMGGKKVVVSEYIPGKDLGDQDLSSPEQIKKFGEQIIRGHAIDALINNRDVFGLNFDNIRIGENGEVYRIDNGGSFDTKATGGKKPYDGVPLEFFSMLERGGGKEFYHDVPIRKAYNSLNSLFENINELKEIGNNQVPENLRKQYFLRLNNLREIKDCWDFARSSNYGDDQECHEALKRYVTELHKKDPNDVVSYVGFKKFLRSI